LILASFSFYAYFWLILAWWHTFIFVSLLCVWFEVILPQTFIKIKRHFGFSYRFITQILKFINLFRKRCYFPFKVQFRIISFKYENLVIAWTQHNSIFELSFLDGNTDHTPVIENTYIFTDHIRHIATCGL